MNQSSIILKHKKIIIKLYMLDAKIINFQCKKDCDHGSSPQKKTAIMIAVLRKKLRPYNSPQKKTTTKVAVFRKRL